MNCEISKSNVIHGPTYVGAITDPVADQNAESDGKLLKGHKGATDSGRRKFGIELYHQRDTTTIARETNHGDKH